jgi:hypothetical protein
VKSATAHRQPVVHNWKKKMIDKLGLTYNIKFELKYSPEEIKNRIENLNLETNILQTSQKKR